MNKIEILKNILLFNNKIYIDENRANKILHSEYQMQAANFLLETETKIEIDFKGLRCPGWDNGKKEVFSYSVTLKNKNHSYTFDYYSSISKTEKNEKSTYDFYSVLACLGYYTPESFDEFCQEFGYEFRNESDYIRVKSIHLACIEQNRNIKKLFNEDQRQKLSEIN